MAGAKRFFGGQHNSGQAKLDIQFWGEQNKPRYQETLLGTAEDMAGSHALTVPKGAESHLSRSTQSSALQFIQTIAVSQVVAALWLPRLLLQVNPIHLLS